MGRARSSGWFGSSGGFVWLVFFIKARMAVSLFGPSKVDGLLVACVLGLGWIHDCCLFPVSREFDVGR
jgi:hypothetical protein